MSNAEVVHAYRHLFRGLLRAVQYSGSARYVVRDALRWAFREPGAAHDAEGVRRTLWFLDAAAKERGLEHRILKNLLRVRLQRYGIVQGQKLKVDTHDHSKNPMLDHEKTAYRHYDMTVAMLNKTMGLCLR